MRTRAWPAVVAVGAAGALLAVGAPGAVATGWAGTITLSASPSSTSMNSPTSTLTVTLSTQLVPGGYVMVFDDTGAQRMCSFQRPSTTFTAYVTPATHAARTYTAYVASSCPATPPAAPDGTSAPVTVTNAGYSGSVTLAADPATTSLTTSQQSLLSASMDQAKPGGLVLGIYDEAWTRVGCTSVTNQVSAAGGPPPHQSRTYTAYLAATCPIPGPPTGVEATSNSVGVSNIGYTGSFAMTANPHYVDSSSPTTSLGVSMNPGLPSGWSMSVYDNTGSLIRCSSSTGSLGLNWYATPPANTARTYTAYLAPTCPATGPPPAYERAVPVAVHSGLDNPADIDFTAASTAILAARTASAACLELSFSPTATHDAGSSLSDQQIACETTLAAGGTFKTALQSATDTAAAGASAWWLLHQAISSNPPTAPRAMPPNPTGEEGEPRTGAIDPAPSSPPAVWRLSDIGASLIARNPSAILTSAQANAIAKECAWRAARAGLNAFHACTTMPIFAPGDSAPETTIHDAIALDTWEPWVQLNWEDPSGKTDTTWRDDRCATEAAKPGNPPPPLQCDEYPFNSTIQGGNGKTPTPHLKYVTATDNQSQGGSLNAFYNACLGPIPRDPRPFLVIPLAVRASTSPYAYSTIGIPTQKLCNNGS